MAGLHINDGGKDDLVLQAYSVNQAASTLGVCRKTLYRMMGDGTLTWMQVGKRRRVVLDESVIEASDQTALCTKEVARLCNLGVAAVRTFVREGHLEAVTLPGSNHLRFTHRAVERFMRRLGVPLPSEFRNGSTIRA